MQRSRSLALMSAAATLLSLSAAPTSAVEISLVPAGSSGVSAGFLRGSDSEALTSVPDSAFAAAAGNGSAASNSATISDSSLEFSFEQSSSGIVISTVFSDGSVAFISDADVGYVLSGAYSAADPDGGRLFWRVTLWEINSPTFLFENRQQSNSTPNESFVLGLQGGDELNVLTGSLSGTLIAGRQYRLLSTTSFKTDPDTTPATTMGHLMLAFAPIPLVVGIDIKPGGDSNRINVRSNGVVAVAILGSESFYAGDVDVATLAFGPAGAPSAQMSRSRLKDPNRDGYADLVAHFRTQDTGIGSDATEACLTGELFDGTPFAGCDGVQVRPSGR